jgi:AcrR family transcriptional regulator
MAAAVDIDRAHGRAPQQERSRETLARITEAAEALFAERGYDGASVGDIAAKARCSVGAFYARFKDKESLLLHVHDRQCAALVERMAFLCDLQRAENASLEGCVRQIVRGLFRHAAGRRSLTRVFIERGGADAAFHARYAAAWAEVRKVVLPLLVERKREIGHAQPEDAADFVLQMLHAAWANDVLHHKMRDITGQKTGDALIASLIDASLAYLRGRIRNGGPRAAASKF